MRGKEKERKKGNAFSVILNIEGIVIIVAVLLILVPLFLPRIMGYQTYNVISGSMEPEIPVGSLVLTKSASPEDIREGDIIVFHRGGSVVTHRVVEKQTAEQQFITKGDANPTNDLQPIPFQDLIGKVTRHYAHLGKLLGFFSTWIGKIILIVAVAFGALLQILAGKLRR